MSTVSAFVGHSFREEDERFVQKILEYLSTVEHAVPGFAWDHAQGAEPKQVSAKVLEKIEGKNLFIGICSANESAVRGRGLRSAWSVLTNGGQQKASEWIIQEIGLAIGRRMKIILLVEEGVRTPGGLQGDLEYISFERHAVERAFSRLLDMIAALRPVEPSAAAPPAAEAAPSAVDAPPAAAATVQDQPDDDPRQKLLFAVFDAGFEGKLDDVKAAVKAARTADPRPAEIEVAEMYALSLDHLRYRGQGIALDELRELATQFPGSVAIRRSFASALERLGELNAASTAYLQAAEVSDVPDIKASLLFSAVAVLHRDGRTQDARALTHDLEQLVDLQAPQAASVVAAVAKAWDELGEFDRFCALSELALELDPALESERFALAHTCADRDLHFLAFIHYRALVIAKADHASGWNNLGVAAEALKFPVRATAAYERARDLKNARAAGNLAHRLIDIGLLASAKHECDDALDKIGTDERITEAQARLQAAPEEENKRIEKLESDTRPLREFLRSWARAYFSAAPIPPRLRLTASLEDGTVTLECDCDGETIQGRAVRTTPPKLGFGLGQVTKGETHVYAVRGTLRNRAADITFREADDGTPKTVLAGLLGGDQRSYLAIIDTDGSAMFVRQPISTSRSIVRFMQA